MASASTAKAAKTSLEPSEIFCAVGLIMLDSEMVDLCNDNTGTSLLSWAKKEGIDLLKNGKIDYDNNQKFEKMFTDQPTESSKQEKLIANIVAGFSAAIGVKKWMSQTGNNVQRVKNVYLTGSKWPQAVDKFRLQNEDTGFDYNSSDIVCDIDGESYYGISLKKKKNVKAQDPTMLNKAYDTFLQGPGPEGVFTKAREDMLYARQEYFPQIVKNAQREGYINIPGLLEMSNNQLWNTKIKDTKKNKNIDLINLKGTNQKYDETDPDVTEFPDSLFNPMKGVKGLRDYINKDLGANDNELYKEFERVIENNAKHFAEGLIDITLKTHMQSKLSAKDIGNYQFNFALVTGYGDFTIKSPVTNSVLRLNGASVLPQHTILEGLSILADDYGGYKLKYNKMKKYKSGAAKLFYTLKRKNKEILDIELRYKGNFKQQPQFFATLAEPFKKQLYSLLEVKR